MITLSKIKQFELFNGNYTDYLGNEKKIEKITEVEWNRIQYLFNNAQLLSKPESVNISYKKIITEIKRICDEDASEEILQNSLIYRNFFAAGQITTLIVHKLNENASPYYHSLIKEVEDNINGLYLQNMQSLNILADYYQRNGQFHKIAQVQNWQNDYEELSKSFNLLRKDIIITLSESDIKSRKGFWERFVDFFTNQ